MSAVACHGCPRAVRMLALHTRSAVEIARSTVHVDRIAGTMIQAIKSQIFSAAIDWQDARSSSAFMPPNLLRVGRQGDYRFAMESVTPAPGRLAILGACASTVPRGVRKKSKILSSARRRSCTANCAGRPSYGQRRPRLDAAATVRVSRNRRVESRRAFAKDSRGLADVEYVRNLRSTFWRCFGWTHTKEPTTGNA